MLFNYVNIVSPNILHSMWLSCTNCYCVPPSIAKRDPRAALSWFKRVTTPLKLPTVHAPRHWQDISIRSTWVPSPLLHLTLKVSDLELSDAQVRFRTSALDDRRWKAAVDQIHEKNSMRRKVTSYIQLAFKMRRNSNCLYDVWNGRVMLNIFSIFVNILDDIVDGALKEERL